MDAGDGENGQIKAVEFMVLKDVFKGLLGVFYETHTEALNKFEVESLDK